MVRPAMNWIIWFIWSHVSTYNDTQSYVIHIYDPWAERCPKYMKQAGDVWWIFSSVVSKVSNPYAQCLHLQARASKKVPRPKEMPSFPTEQHVRVLRKSVVRSLLDSDLRKQSRLSWLGWGVKHPLVLLYITMLGSCFAESKPEFPSPTFRSHCWPNWPSSRRRNQKHFCSASQKRSWVAHSVNHSSWQHQITWHVKTLPDLPCHHLQLRFPSHRQNLHDKSRHGICASEVCSLHS